MKTLAQRCRNSFDRSIRLRGEVYSHGGHISSVQIYETGLKVVVEVPKIIRLLWTWGQILKSGRLWLFSARVPISLVAPYANTSGPLSWKRT